LNPLLRNILLEHKWKHYVSWIVSTPPKGLWDTIKGLESCVLQYYKSSQMFQQKSEINYIMQKYTKCSLHLALLEPLNEEG